MTFVWVVAIAFAIYLLWRLFGSPAVAEQNDRDSTVQTTGNIRGGGDFECDVVGESKYQNHLERIAGGRTDDSAKLRKQAILVLEDDNTHDKNAVRVYIDGLTVGYLSRETAKVYRRQLKRQKLPIGNYTCDAMIVGGWDRSDGDVGHFGVRLDVPITD